MIIKTNKTKNDRIDSLVTNFRGYIKKTSALLKKKTTKISLRPVKAKMEVVEEDITKPDDEQSNPSTSAAPMPNPDSNSEDDEEDLSNKP